ncbi:acetylxylan esterase [Sedimentisphaera salicampi]|uniref:acetylxylan esterase n=1 Tax=Sedimentisphaera salicampi TaxID=1941349 RepID=UPI000B9A2E1E|nr:acetylxylan esterase [Sedimentisphaera salicampi]OXU15128.1 Acetyl esterase Axe7A precursor [Sedimentisphaera salicampi]
MNPEIHKLTVAFLFSVLAVFTSNSFAETISFNFGFSSTDVAGAAGAYPYAANNWNNATSGAAGSMTDLIDSSGVSTGISISWSSNEVWHRSSSASGDDEKLMKSFLNDTPPGGDRSQSSTDPSTVTVSNLPGGAYDLVIYSDGDETNIEKSTIFNVNDGSGVITKTANDLVQYPDDGYVLDSGLNYRSTNNDSDYGNYLVFENLQGTSVQIEFHGENDISWRGHLNGIQIVSNLGIVPPQNLSAFDISSNKAHLSWESAGAGSAVDGYKVYRDGVNIADVTAAEYVDYCLSPDTQYSYQVSAYNSEDESDLSPSLAVETMSFGDLAGDGAVDTNDLRVLLFNWLESGMCIQGDLNNDSIVNLVDYSELLSHWTYPDITAPSVPQNLSVSDVTSASVSLTWQSSADDTAVAGYYVYRDGAQVSSSGDNYFTDFPLISQTSYSYQVAAYDAAGNISQRSDLLNVTTDDSDAESLMTSELLDNPSFETGGSSPDNWVMAGSKSVLDSSVSHTGSRSIRLEGSADTQIRQTVELNSNSYYQLSAHVKLNGLLDKATSAKGVSIRIRRADNSVLTFSEWDTTDMNWEKKKIAFVTSSGGDHYIEIAFNLEDGEYFHIDDISLRGIVNPSSPSAQTSGLSADYSGFPENHFFDYANPLTVPVKVTNSGDSTLQLIAVVTLDHFSTRKSLIADTHSILFEIEPGQTKTLNAAFENVSAGGYEITASLIYNGEVVLGDVRTHLIFDPYNYDLVDYKPADFDQYWSQAMADARAVPLNPIVDYNHNRPGVSSEWAVVEFNANSNRKGRGFLLIPPHNPGDKLPVKISCPGAGYSASPLDTSGLYEGYVYLAMSVHDLPFDHPTIGRAHSTEHYNTSDAGAYMRTGLESRDTYFYRDAYIAMARAVDFVRTLDMVDPDRVAVGGGSQGGALAFAAASLVPDVALVTVNSPGRARWDKCTWDPAYYTPHQSYTPPEGMSKRDLFLNVLAYCDSAIHASRITAPVAVGIPLADEIDSSVLQWKAFDSIVNSPDKRFVVNPYGPHLDVDMSSLVQSMETLYLFNEDN